MMVGFVRIVITLGSQHDRILPSLTSLYGKCGVKRREKMSNFL
jgi:hypothetical protein